MFDEEALLNPPSHLDAPVSHAGSSHSLFIIAMALVTSGTSAWAGEPYPVLTAPVQKSFQYLSFPVPVPGLLCPLRCWWGIQAA